MKIRKEDCPFLEGDGRCELHMYRDNQFCNFIGNCDTLDKLESLIERVLEIERRKREDHQGD